MRRYRGLVLYAATVLLLLLAYYVSPLSPSGLSHGLSLTEARFHVGFAGIAIAFFFLAAALAYFAFPSMPLIYVAAGYCMDSVFGGLIVLSGSAIGSLGAFLLYRKYIPDRLRLPSTEHSPLKLWLALLGLRLSPIVPAPLVNFFAAFCNMSVAQFFTTTLIGSAPLVLFYETLGQQGHNYVSGETIQLWQILSYLGILAASTLLSALGPWRSFLKTIKRVRDEVFASMGASEGANWMRAKATAPVGD